MTAEELMTAYSRRNFPNGAVSGSDKILALSRDENTPFGSYLAFTGAAEIKAETVSELAKRRYFLSGGSFHRRTAVRKFSVIMRKDRSDPLQSILCDPEILFGTEQQCIFNYIYFDAVSGMGETGTVTADVICDSDGAADSPALISVELYGCGAPPETMSIRNEE